MSDTLTSVQRSERMSRIRYKNSKPEMAVRRLVHAMGYRYRLHRKDLAGKPDLVFPSRRKVVFVHGCFWHRHPDPDCKLARLPKSRLEFWLPKLEGNCQRDEKNINELVKIGWTPLIIWECQTKNVPMLEDRIATFLEDLT